MSSVEYADDGVRIYDSEGNLVGHLGHFEGLGDQIAAFSRSSAAYKQNGSQVAAGAPRFEAAEFGQGVMVEEGTTNLLTANQSNLGIDTTGWQANGQAAISRISESGEYLLQTACTGVVGTPGCLTTQISISPSTTYAFSLHGYRTAGAAAYLFVEGRRSDSSAHNLHWAQVLLPTTKGRVSCTFTTEASDVSIRVGVLWNNPVVNEMTKITRIQVEAKAYPTSWQIGGTQRAAETLTIPTAGVFSKDEGTIEFIFHVDENTQKSSKMLFSTATSTTPGSGGLYPNSIQAYIGTSGIPYTTSDASGNGTTIDYNNPDIPTGQHKIAFTWSTTQLKIMMDGAILGTVDTPYLPVTLATNLYVGSWITGIYVANTIFDDLRISSRARTLAEHQAYVSSGKPHTVDDDTTLLMSMDGHLRPTVRGHGLWDKNGRLILQDPQQGQGLEVWDNGTRKILIGKLVDGTIGQEIVGGELYSSLFRTGSKTDTAYVALVSPNLLQIFGFNSKQLEIEGSSNGGHIAFYTDGVLSGHIYAHYQYLSPIYMAVQATNRPLLLRSDSGNVKILSANEVRIEPASGKYCVIDGNLGNTGNASLNNLYTTGSKYAVQKTDHYGMRGLSARESSDSRYIDEGVDELSNGECRVELDPIFLECVEKNVSTTPWLIHLTPCSDNNVFVKEIGDTYFIVKESAAGNSNNKFFWSLSAIRKGWAGRRLEELSPKDTEDIQTLMDKVSSSPD